MKKQVILSSWLISLVTTILVLIISIIIVINYRNANSEESISEYLSFSSSMYDGTNYEALNKELKNVNNSIRLTIVDLDGNIVFNTNTYNVFSDHLDRDEVKDLGTIFYRANIFNQETLYIASKDSAHYLILAFPLPSVGEIIGNLILASMGLFIVALILSYFILEWVNKKAFKPMQLKVESLSDYADDGLAYNASDIISITTKLHNIYKGINDKFNAIIDEKDKMEFIVDNMHQGILVLDDMGKIVLINEYANKIFKNPRDTVTTSFLGKHYLYLVRNVTLQNQIEETILQGTYASFDINIDNRIYLININPSVNKWTVVKGNRNGVALLILDVTERRNLEHTKRDFFANASHELKSPLTTILGYQQMISENVITTPEEVEDAVKRTIKEAKRMDSILGEMLELSRIESKFEANIEDVNLKDIIEDIIDSFKLEIDEKQLIVKVNVEDYIVRMNNSHCSQLLNNLIENAVKYNRQGGKLEISLKGDKLHIKDTGIGIAKENQNRIFERFYRVDKSRSKELGGTGLGLAIVKHICSVYSIGININSDLNKGTEFILSFPKK